MRCCGIYGFPGDQDVSDESNGERDRDRDHDAVVHQFSSLPMLSPPIRSSIASMPMARGIVVPLRLRRGERSTGSRSRAGVLVAPPLPDGFLQRAEILLARCINAYSRGNVSRLWQRCLRWICRANAERPLATRRAATTDAWCRGYPGGNERSKVRHRSVPWAGSRLATCAAAAFASRSACAFARAGSRHVLIATSLSARTTRRPATRVRKGCATVKKPSGCTKSYGK